MKAYLEVVKFDVTDVITASATGAGSCGDTDNTIPVPCGGPLD